MDVYGSRKTGRGGAHGRCKAGECPFERQWRRAFATHDSLRPNPPSFQPSVPKKPLTDDQQRPHVSLPLLRATPTPQNRPLGRPANYTVIEAMSGSIAVMPISSSFMSHLVMCFSGVSTCLKTTTFLSSNSFFLHLHSHSVVWLLFPQSHLHSRFQLAEPPSLR